jgi:hypothetical protein
MRKLTASLIAAFFVTALMAPSTMAGPAATSVPRQDDLVSDQTYVRHDGGTDEAIALCNSRAPDVFGNNVQNNEPFSVVSPTNPDLVVAGWNDYCSDWMGLAFSTNGGESWTNSLVPGYPQDTSKEGMRSPEFLRTNAASDPVAAFDRTGDHFYFGAISYNQFAGPRTNSDVWVARYDVLRPGDAGYRRYPLDYIGTTQVGRGPAAANFFGIFHDKEMIEVDRTGGPHDGNLYECWTKFPGFGTARIYFARSTDGGRTFSKGISLAGKTSGQGCDIAVEADGDVYVSWRDFETPSSHRNFGVSVVRSSDGGLTFSKPVKIADIVGYNPFDTFARDCGDGAEACPARFVFARVPLEPRLTSDPTGELEGVYSVFQAVGPRTVEPSETSYSSTGPGTFGTNDVGRSFVWISRSLDDGANWSEPAKVSDSARGHQFFPDADALAGRLAVIWQDSRVDPCYDVQLPIGNTPPPRPRSCGDDIVNAYVSVSTDGATFGRTIKASTVANQPQYEMFADRNIPFYGDYNWIQLAEAGGDSLFGYLSWTDNRDVVTGTDPREKVQDGFDVHQCRRVRPGGSYGPDTCPNAGGLNQNIYGNSITIP